MRSSLAFIILVACLGLVPAAPVPGRLDADRKALHSTDPVARRAAVLRLGWLGRDAAPAVPDLARALRDPDDAVAHDAANALVRVGPPAAEALGKALSDDTPAARWYARIALSRMGLDAKDAVPALADRVRNAKSHQLRVNAALILGRMGPTAKEALPALRAAASDRAAELTWHRARPSSVCETAIIATRAIDPDALKELAAAALPTLRAMLLEDGDDENTLAGRRAAVHALAMLGLHAAPALTDLQTARLLGRVDTSDFARACFAMGKDGQKHLVELITDPTEDEKLRGLLLGSLSGLPGLGANAIRALVKLLTDGDNKLRCLAVLALAAQGAAAEPAIPALVKALADPTFDNLPDRFGPGFYASDAFARIGPKAVPALRTALKDKATRDRAVIALGRMDSGARDAIPDLRELLAGPPTITSVRTAAALLRIGDAPKEPVRVLVAALNTDVRQEAVGHLAYPGERDAFWLIRGDVRPPAPAVPREAVPMLLKLLDDESCRNQTATVLGSMKGAADVIVPAIGKRLRARADDRSTAFSICQALGPVAKDAVPDILWCLREDKSESTHRSAFWALGAIGPAAKEAIPILTSAAGDPRHCATREAVWALGRLGLESPEVIDTLVKVLRDPAGRPGRRDRSSSAAGVLMQLGPAAKRAIPSLREAQLSDDAIVRVYATAALLRAGDAETPIERLLSAWRDSYDPDEMYPVMPHWLEAIELLGPLAAKAVPQLVILLADPMDAYEEDNRAHAARALGAIGPEAKAALPRLRVLAAQSGPPARAAALAIRAIAGD